MRAGRRLRGIPGPGAAGVAQTQQSQGYSAALAAPPCGAALAPHGRMLQESLEKTQPLPDAQSPAWDLLLVCVAVYVAASVGRIHELFPILLMLKPALVAALLAIGLYSLQRSRQRRLGLLRSPMMTCVLGLLLWGALSVPRALNQGLAFQSWPDFVRTIVMSVVVAGTGQRPRDVGRLMLVYLAVTVVYVAVVLS